MPLFDAGVVVESLEYDFTKAGVKAKGTIPEPTDEQIGQFLGGLRELARKASEVGDLEVDDTDPAAMLGLLNSLDPVKFVEVLSSTSEVYAKLCSDRPTAEQISALPLRVRYKFFGWLQSEVVSPEAGPGAGNAQVVTLPRTAAG
jgi:hypothetical protein